MRVIASVALCAAILIALYLAELFHWLPRSELVRACLIVVIPLLLIIIVAWRAHRAIRHVERQSADDALSVVESHLIDRL